MKVSSSLTEDPVTYMDGSSQISGIIVRDKTRTGPLPIVIVVPAWGEFSCTHALVLNSTLSLSQQLWFLHVVCSD